MAVGQDVVKTVAKCHLGVALLQKVHASQGHALVGSGVPMNRTDHGVSMICALKHLCIMRSCVHGAV